MAGPANVTNICPGCGQMVPEGYATRGPDSFADALTSLAEARAHKMQDGRKWTPRDALISTLRKLDAGEIAPTQLVILYACPPEKPDKECTTGYCQATTGKIELQGLIMEGIRIAILDM